jgi:NAD(P)-dependent dehydrogenase (short-subunit alcohol dehydrogenase family)
MRLAGKTAIVLGASGGIGSVFARKFYEAGANVVLAARNEKKLIDVAKNLGSERTMVAPVDAADQNGVPELFERARERFGGVDGVVISVGSWKQLNVGDSLALAVGLFEEHVQSLLRPSFLVGYTAAQYFNFHGRGLIANISSHAAVRAELPGNLTYGPMKAAARHFMLALRHELAGSGVRVVDIQPAIVNTPGNRDALATDKQRALAVQPEAIAEWLIEHFDDPEIPPEKLFDSQVVL